MLDDPAPPTLMAPSVTSFSDLADDDVLSILVVLSARDVISVARTCTRLRLLCNEVRLNEHQGCFDQTTRVSAHEYVKNICVICGGNQRPHLQQPL